ncbi:MAG: ATP-binding protein [Candidatus Omnitrophota bacterium]
MTQKDIQALIQLFKESIGVEAAEKIVYEAVKNAGLPLKTYYTEEEFNAVCEVLKKRGGFIRTIASVASSSAYSNVYYEEALARERKEKEDLARLSNVLEQKVEERTEQLKEAQVQLVQSAKMAAVGQLGAGIAHELNNPLGGILGYAQFILEKFSKPGFGVNDFKACQRYIESIEREAARCKRIVENLLKFSRRPISAKPEPLDMARAIEETLSIVGHQLKLKNVRVITDFKPGLAKVMGIINQLQQVFTNLILNAQQAMPDGGELKISVENIIDEKTRGPSGIKIEFADTGCGIAEEDLSRIFEPFFTTKQKEKGTGLGLTVSYQIVQEHNGSISLRSEVGKGTIFTITLPAAEK